MPPLSPLARRVHDFSRSKSLLEPGDGVLVGLSGGADSVALLLLLGELSGNGALPLRISAAHLNHGMRGEAAATDADFCRGLARRRGVQFVEGRIDVAGRRRPGESLEQAARRLRYAFLVDAAAARGWDKVAVAHHADDQAETVIMRLSRGCGLNGLEAIQPRRPSVPRPEIAIVRPLLNLRKKQLTEYLRRQGQGHRTDASNRELRFRRNRVRHALLPRLIRGCGEDLTGILSRMARAAGEINAQLKDVLQATWQDICSERDKAEMLLDAGILRGLSAEMRKRILRHALGELSACRGTGPNLSRQHLEELSCLVERPVGTELSLPGECSARREHGGVYLRRGNLDPTFHPTALPVPSTVRLPAAGRQISAEFRCMPRAGMADLLLHADENNVYLSPTALDLPLTVRPRRPGDRFHPLGGPGSKKLKSFLIDRKIPQHVRDVIPLVVDASGRMAWVGGHEIAEEFRLAGEERCVLHLWMEPLAERPESAQVDPHGGRDRPVVGA